MRSSTILLAAATVACAVASPLLVKKANFDAPLGGDIDILNYALTLEYLERNFYQQGLKNFTSEDFCKAGFDATFYANLKEIYADEQSHVSFLAAALGEKAVKEATYTFPVTDAKSFVALSSILEGVGVSAYVGAAAAIANKAYLTVAGSILGVEARHAAYVRAAVGQSPFPKAYETPLDFKQVYSLAAQFITGFAPGSPALPFMAFPPLQVRVSQHPHAEGRSSVTFEDAYANALAMGSVAKHTKVYAVFYSGLDTYYSPVYITQGDKDYKIDKIPGQNSSKTGQLPPTGQVYVVLSTADGTGKNLATDENTISGVGIIEVQMK